jgi:hypothetical protein
MLSLFQEAKGVSGDLSGSQAVESKRKLHEYRARINARWGVLSALKTYLTAPIPDFQFEVKDYLEKSDGHRYWGGQKYPHWSNEQLISCSRSIPSVYDDDSSFIFIFEEVKTVENREAVKDV